MSEKTVMWLALFLFTTIIACRAAACVETTWGHELPSVDGGTPR